ncbi:hypothetical protein A2U01_0059120, partial [Trifolium medium]|nr:hypothetical protein [Trifolium medium]
MPRRSCFRHKNSPPKDKSPENTEAKTEELNDLDIGTYDPKPKEVIRAE